MTDDEAVPSGGEGDKKAELLAAVRAVERGERAAASFFTGTGEGATGAGAGGRGAGAPRPRPAPASASEPASGPSSQPTSEPGRLPEGGGPVHVPDGVRQVLAAGEAPESLGVRVVETLGGEADQLLREDPWLLLTVPGVLPEQADGFARSLLAGACGPEDERRAQALVGWLLERAALRGHTALEPGELTKGLAQHAVPEPDEALRAAVDAGGALVFEDALDAMPGGGSRRTDGGPETATATETGTGTETDSEGERPVRLLMGLERYALAEESLAEGLARLMSTCPAAPDEPDEPAERDTETAAGGPRTAGRREWETAAEAAPSPSAAELIRAAAAGGLVAHTGGEAARAEPAALVGAARGSGLRAYAAAHCESGRSRLVRLLHEWQGTTITEPAETPGEAAGEAADDTVAAPAHEAAITVSGLLAGREGPNRDPEGAWQLDLLVVCDAPQLDAETAASLVESLPDGARLVLSGDPSVLQSAGPGRVFADVLAARVCPTLASRTPDPGPIGELVSGIGVGELTEVSASGKEVVIVPVREAGEAVHRTVQLVADSVPRAIGVPSEHTQVITPGHGGAAGTRALNSALKERLNPGPGRFAGFDPGDRVAHSPAPGRTTLGTVVSADDDGLRIQDADSGQELALPPDRVAGALRHGWAVTAHQAAGLRRPAAVVVLPGDATDVLTREWVYTAFGRGERHLSVVQGADQALPHAVASVHSPERTTRLRTLLAAAAQAARPAADEEA